MHCPLGEKCYDINYISGYDERYPSYWVNCREHWLVIERLIMLESGGRDSDSVQAIRVQEEC